MFLYTLKFEIEEEQIIFLQEFFTRDEIEAAKEEKEITPDIVSVDPISDTEEEQTKEEEEVQGREGTQVMIDHNTNPPLPSNKDRSTQIRASVRARKRIRYNEDLYQYYQRLIGWRIQPYKSLH